MNVLSLVTDAYGGHGGIALYNRDLFDALSLHPERPANKVIPRLVVHPLEPLPENLTFMTSAQNSKIKFVLTVLRTIAPRPRFDLVLCSHVNLLPLAQLVRRWCGGKVVQFVYGVDVWEPTARPTVNALLSKIDALVSIRRYTAERVKEWAGLDGVPVFILENAIHLERYGVRPRDPDLVRRFGLEGKRVVMTLGRVEETRKGFDETIEVMPDLAREHPDLVYVVAGGGYDVPRLQRKAAELGVEERVIFTGPVPEDEKPAYYRLADVFAMPGTGHDFDRYPLRFVFLEAMACGVQVVGCVPEHPGESSRDLGLPTIEVDPFDRESIKQGIREGLARPRGVVPAALERYAWPAFRDKLHAIVDGLVPSAALRRGASPSAAGVPAAGSGRS